MLNSVYKPSLAFTGVLTGTSGASATARFEVPINPGLADVLPPIISVRAIGPRAVTDAVSNSVGNGLALTENGRPRIKDDAGPPV
jgi:hypothetical protein